MNDIKNKLESIWGITEMELLPLTKSELLIKIIEIGNMVNGAINMIEDAECSHCGNVTICESCVEEMCTNTVT
jgi:hypothetical protein